MASDRDRLRIRDPIQRETKVPRGKQLISISTIRVCLFEGKNARGLMGRFVIG
jgi:hypothetical protein